MGRTIVVTCGATVPFPLLVKAVLTEQFLYQLKTWRFDRLVVQYGKGYANHFQQTLLDQLPGVEGSPGALADLAADSKAWISPCGVEICAFEFTTRIQDLLRLHADVVVSHAGTGSILDALRLQKPLVVVANTDLMDNHQLQIAEKFESRGHLVSALRCDTESVVSAIEKVLAQAPQPLADSVNDDFSRLLAAVAWA
ncbi:LADA_0C09472g1_1 [Lachancea dasiensis]|uniref:UDP-N-acetylglucosamine transferase subunit ALG13 n=1 Tax=Lachancea dasiensis TaxID=1072105 RepID=A0A1G4J0H0_9SACH|nr:LADA_0C09472g1_1 [Lachancea dasiensis]